MGVISEHFPYKRQPTAICHFKRMSWQQPRREVLQALHYQEVKASNSRGSTWTQFCSWLSSCSQQVQYTPLSHSLYEETTWRNILLTDCLAKGRFKLKLKRGNNDHKQQWTWPSATHSYSIPDSSPSRAGPSTEPGSGKPSLSLWLA